MTGDGTAGEKRRLWKEKLRGKGKKRLDEEATEKKKVHLVALLHGGWVETNT